MDTNPQEAHAPLSSPGTAQRRVGGALGTSPQTLHHPWDSKQVNWDGVIAPAPLFPFPTQAGWAPCTVYTSFFILRNDVTSLIIHVVVKRVSFAVSLFELTDFSGTSPSLKFLCLENGADNIVLETADVM